MLKRWSAERVERCRSMLTAIDAATDEQARCCVVQSGG